MKIQILAFGIAKDIIKAQTIEVDMEEGNDIGSLKKVLCGQFPDFQKLQSLSIAVNTEYQKDDYMLHENDEVVIIPPVSGG
ncbi:MAG: molybdopterin converting factor subunit 1 [Saprospiraceae bacterium]|jgi:molybdopterin converting factor subunit 1